MKKAIILISVTLILWACKTRNEKPDAEQKPVLTVSILPQKFFIEQIAGDYFDINVMVPPGADPHEYEPTARQMTNLSRSEVYFFVGHLGFEKAWLSKMAASAPDVVLVSNSMGLDLIVDEAVHKDEGESFDQHGTDPHIWTSPENVKTICRNMCSILSANHPEQKETFEKNLEHFVATIDGLDFNIREQLNNAKRKTFMIFHPALSYFSRDFFLTQYAIEFEGKTPSPAHMKKVIDFTRASGIKTIFIQSQFETAKAEAIARETGAQVVSIDPLAYNWVEEMVSLTDKLKIALNQ